VRAAALLAALLLPAALHAQAPPPYLPVFDKGMHSGGMALGVANPMESGGFSSKAKRGPAIGFQYRYYTSDWIAVGADLGMNMYGKMTAPDGTAYQTSAIAFQTVLRLNLLRETSWTPYMLGGIGFNSFSLKSTPPLRSTAPSLSEKTTGPAFSAGGGLEFFVMRGLSMFFETRWNGYKRPKSTHGDFDAITGQLGLAMWFNFE
jgi:opacity protein-like surface antigen